MWAYALVSRVTGSALMAATSVWNKVLFKTNLSEKVLVLEVFKQRGLWAYVVGLPYVKDMKH